MADLLQYHKGVRSREEGCINRLLTLSGPRRQNERKPQGDQRGLRRQRAEHCDGNSRECNDARTPNPLVSFAAQLLPGLLAGAEGLDHGARSEPTHNPDNGLKKEPEDVVSEGTGVGAAAMGNRRCSNTRG
jgi:hypothetical protein